MTYAPYRVCSV